MSENPRREVNPRRIIIKKQKTREREVGPAKKSQSKLYFPEKIGRPYGKNSLEE
jgi:hypothetical protein